MLTVYKINEATMHQTKIGEFANNELQAARDRANAEIKRARKFVRVVVTDAGWLPLYEARGQQ